MVADNRMAALVAAEASTVVEASAVGADSMAAVVAGSTAVAVTGN